MHVLSGPYDIMKFECKIWDTFDEVQRIVQDENNSETTCDINFKIKRPTRIFEKLNETLKPEDFNRTRNKIFTQPPSPQNSFFVKKTMVDESLSFRPVSTAEYQRPPDLQLR
jgi:hypothetical protein